MKRYLVQGRPVALFSGCLDLTRAQAEPRLGMLEGHVLAKLHSKGTAKSDMRVRYLICGEVQFKVGEIIGYDGEVPKALSDVLVDLDAVAAAETALRAADVLRDAERAANELAAQQTDELVAAMSGITGDDNANIALDELLRLLAGRINFDPTPEQLEAAWAAHVAKR